MSQIIIDHRENNIEIIKELVKSKIDFEKKQLLVADFVIQSKSQEGKIVEVAIERKTLNDFLNSIIDKRIITQLIALKENYEIPLLIIEGSENIYAIRNFHPNAIRGMLSSIAIDFQIPILFTKNYRDTASYLIIIAKRLEKPIKDISLLKKRKPLTLKERQELIIETLPSVGPKIAKSLLKKFKTVKKVITANEKKLIRVEKIGPKKAKEIEKVINEPYSD